VETAAMKAEKGLATKPEHARIRRPPRAWLSPKTEHFICFVLGAAPKMTKRFVDIGDWTHAMLKMDPARAGN